MASRVADVGAHITAWRLVVERTAETPRATLVFGRRDDRPVVLKVLERVGDEWQAGAVMQAFDGRGMVRVLDRAGGAILMERALPGESLSSLVAAGRDDDAIGGLIDVLGRLEPRGSFPEVPTVEDWSRAFAGGHRAVIPALLHEEAAAVYAALSGTQSRSRLLHGDLHHDNVLWDAARGWLAIDPKGVIGEPEFEIGAALRNPIERPDVFLQRRRIERLVTRAADVLRLDAGRILGWAFAQAVLATLWAIEDGETIDRRHAWLALAGTIRPMLGSHPW